MSNKNEVNSSDIKERLEYLRGELRAERMSYSELDELQSLIKHIDPSDVELLQAAGFPEVAEVVSEGTKIAEWPCGRENDGKEIEYEYNGDHYIVGWEPGRDSWFYRKEEEEEEESTE